jgi:hypothetical protein
VLPAIVTGLTNEAEIVQHETFAPILYVMKYKTWTKPSTCRTRCRRACRRRSSPPTCKRAEAFLSAAVRDCGIANVNIGTSGAEIGGAFGGEKETGGGRESGSMRGRPTCAGRPTPSTTPTRCRWRRASSSTSEDPTMNAMPRQTSTLAIISLVAGILGWTVDPFLGSIAR